MAEINLQDPTRHLDHQTLLQKMKDPNIFLVDVREVKEIEDTGKLPTSTNIPLSELESALALPTQEFENIYKSKKPLPDQEIIFSCRSGNRSYKAMEKVAKMGFSRISHYKGGWLEWDTKNKMSQN